MVKILACVDGSRFSASVCDHAAWAATRTAATVDVVHVLDRPRASSGALDLSGAFEIDIRETLLKELADLDEQQSTLAQRRGWHILDDARARLIAAGVSSVQVHQRQGAVVDTLADLDHDIDVTVIGKRGASADVARPHLGSNLERVVRASRHPVFVVPEAFKPISRFLLAFDGGPTIMLAVERLARSPLLAGLACHLLMVGSGSDGADRQLNEAASTLERAGYSVSASSESGHVEQVITAAINRQNADLLVMGAYGHSRIRELIIGSTTTAMLNLSPVPLLLFR